MKQGTSLGANWHERDYGAESDVELVFKRETALLCRAEGGNVVGGVSSYSTNSLGEHGGLFTLDRS